MPYVRKRWRKGSVSKIKSPEEGVPVEWRVGPVPGLDGSGYNWSPNKGAALPQVSDLVNAAQKVRTGRLMTVAYIKEYTAGSDHRIRWVGSRYGARTKAETVLLLHEAYFNNWTVAEFLEAYMPLYYHPEKVFSVAFIEVYG